MEYLVCQSHACHALAACSASAALRRPESRPQLSALESVPSPAVYESAPKQCSIHEWHIAEGAQMAGGGDKRRRKKRGGRREEEGERRRRREEDEERRSKRAG